MKPRPPCPAPELGAKRSRMFISIAIFYRRPIGRAEIREINPDFAAKKIEVDRVFERLVRKGYMDVVGDRFALTKYGYDQMLSYATWRRQVYGPVQ